MDVLRHLQEHGIKLSVQRIAIMGYLMKHLTHPTADEIYTALPRPYDPITDNSLQYPETA